MLMAVGHGYWPENCDKSVTRPTGHVEICTRSTAQALIIIFGNQQRKWVLIQNTDVKILLSTPVYLFIPSSEYTHVCMHVYHYVE